MRNDGGLRPSSPQGAFPLDPSSGCCLPSFAGSVPVKRRVTVIAHGQVGIYAAKRMLCIRGKREITPEEKACFLSRRFLVLIVPVKLLFRFLKLLAHSRSFDHTPTSHTGVQRKNSSGAGYGGRAGPCLTSHASFSRRPGWLCPWRQRGLCGCSFPGKRRFPPGPIPLPA